MAVPLTRLSRSFALHPNLLPWSTQLEGEPPGEPISRTPEVLAYPLFYSLAGYAILTATIDERLPPSYFTRRVSPCMRDSEEESTEEER